MFLCPANSFPLSVVAVCSNVRIGFNFSITALVNVFASFPSLTHIGCSVIYGKQCFLMLLADYCIEFKVSKTCLCFHYGRSFLYSYSVFYDAPFIFGCSSFPISSPFMSEMSV